MTRALKTLLAYLRHPSSTAVQLARDTIHGVLQVRNKLLTQRQYSYGHEESV
jgi:hypothetical protein